MQNLVGHLVDTETAIKDVVRDYQRRGERVRTTLADDLERGLEQYTATAEARRGDVAQKHENLLAKVTKNLQKKPKTEALTKQIKEQQEVLNVQIEEALGLCG